MTAIELLSKLHADGVTVEVDGPDLIFKGKKSALTSNVMVSVSELKPEIMELLVPDPPCLPAAFDRPPETREETVELMEYLADPVAFYTWFESLMLKSDPSETTWNGPAVGK